MTQEFKKYLNCFNTFLFVYNGVSFFQHMPSKIVHLDACPSGLGAIFDSQVYPLPSNYQNANIAYHEIIWWL